MNSNMKNQIKGIKNEVDRVNRQVEGDANSERDNLLEKLWKAKVLIGLALLALLVRCTAEDAAPTQVVTTYEVSNNTDDLIGEAVTIRSKPIEQVGLSSFTIRDARFFSGEPIVVINASGEPFDLPNNRNTRVQVTGEVRNLVISNIERDYNLILPNQYYQDYINKPAIIARSILLAPTPDEITSNPRRFYGRRIALNATIDDIQSPVFFTVDENKLLGGEDLLVFLKAIPEESIDKGETLGMIGELRPFVVSEIERDYNLTWDLRVKRQLEVEYRNKPVFIAETLYDD